MGYFRDRIPRLDWASSPTYESFCPIPTMTPWWRGRPTMEGKTARGASSPAKPALHIPDPLSTTNAATSASHIFYWDFQFNWLCRNQSLGCIVLEMQFQALYEYFIMSYPGYYLPWADVTQNICCGLILNGCVAFQHHIESKILFFAIIKSFQQPRNDSPLQFSQFYNNVQDLCDDSFYLTIQIRS